MKKYEIKIKNPQKESFIIKVLEEFGLIEKEPNLFIEKKEKATNPKRPKKVKA